MQFSNKVAVITGGASGLGLGIAKILGQRNAKLALIDINDEKVQEAAESLLNNGVSVKAFQADVTNEADIDSCINSIEHAKPKNSDGFKLNPSIISKKIDDLTLFGILES